MKLRTVLLAALPVALLAGGGAWALHEGRRVLRVCSDPNNLPFSNEQQEGFENRLAELVARELDARVEYTWWAQRRGFIRNTLRAGACDVVMGVPGSFELVLATRPYYRSTYVFATRAADSLHIASLDDAQLRTLRVGVHLVGDDGANTPPAHALANRGIVENVRGYSLYGDYSEPDPPARILDALARSEIDVAIVWGPLAGFYAKRHDGMIRLEPVLPQIEPPYLPMVFDIAMGVRRDDPELKEELERIITDRAAEIDALLDEFGVPRVETHRIR